MKRKAALGALLALVVAAPAAIAPIVAPSMAPNAQAQAEYPDVPLDHWAYNAINKLSAAGIIEGYPSGQYNGGRAMTRYEFAVAIARLLENLPKPEVTTSIGGVGATGATGAVGPRGEVGPAGAIPDVSIFVRRPELVDAINGLRNEFQTELRALGVRVDDLDARVTALENRVVRAPRLTITPSLLVRQGTANYIRNDANGRAFGGAQGTGGIIDGFFEPGGSATTSNRGFEEDYDLFRDGSTTGNEKFAYTDFELRLTDRVTDKLSVNAALRSISGTEEDPWLIGFSPRLAPSDDTRSENDPSQFFLREANVVADLGDTLGTRNMSLILGRQRTKVASGLLYDNDLWPTDQLHAMASLGPVGISGFIGSANNQTGGSSSLGNRSNYLNSGAVGYMGSNAFFNGNFDFDSTDEFLSGAGVGFPGLNPQFFGPGVAKTDDNEALVRASFNLFRIAGQPVQVGASYLFDGIQNQSGYGVDLTIPLFNRNVGIEYVKQNNYAFEFGGNNNDADGSAYNITLPVLRTRVIDLNLAYGKASDDFEYFVASAANPFARTYGEAIFDRGMALGAPLVNGDGEVGDPQFMAAKKVFDVGGTLRIIRRLPIDFRYYTAEGTEGRELGNVWTVGTSLALTQGLDLELKYGHYNPRGDFDTIKYFRVGANVGF